MNESDVGEDGPRDLRHPAAKRDPEWSKERLLKAARAEFSVRGLAGARVGAIVARAGVNKQLLYYYFTNKEKLYAAVLERAYRHIREAEQALGLDAMPPDKALETFIRFTFDYVTRNRDFVALLNDENLHKARHVRALDALPGLHRTLDETLRRTLVRGLECGAFRRDVDPQELYISIASLCYFQVSNAHTLSAVFAADLAAPERLEARRRHVIDLILSYLRAPAGG